MMHKTQQLRAQCCSPEETCWVAWWSRKSMVAKKNQGGLETLLCLEIHHQEALETFTRRTAEVHTCTKGRAAQKIEGVRPTRGLESSMPTAPCSAMFCYALSAGLDAFDGWAARTYNQSSRFGAMLDQLTDRCALLALVMALCRLFPDHLFWLLLSAVIDIASHWQSTNWLLNLYYTDRMFLGFLCGGNEAFYILLYIRAFWAEPLIFNAFHFMSIFPLIAFPIASHTTSNCEQNFDNNFFF